MVIIMLELVQGFSCHNIDQASREEKEPSSRTKYSSMFLRSYSAILSSVESRKKNKISSFHTVSQYRTSNAGNNMQASQKLCRPTDYADQQIMQNQQYACSNTEPAIQNQQCRQQYAGISKIMQTNRLCRTSNMQAAMQASQIQQCA